jgi:altronate hydrolase
MDVIAYGDRLRTKGLTLISGPGNDLVSSTALTAAGAQMILFTTGRGTPFGAPAPTLKIASNTDLAARKPRWIDFDAGRVLSGASFDDLAVELFREILAVAEGKRTKAELGGYREIAIFKDGVTL